MNKHLQSTEVGQGGEHGNHVQCHVVVVFSYLSGLVPILHLHLEETTAKGKAFAQDPATNEDVLVNSIDSLPLVLFHVIHYHTLTKRERIIVSLLPFCAFAICNGWFYKINLLLSSVAISLRKNIW